MGSDARRVVERIEVRIQPSSEEAYREQVRREQARRPPPPSGHGRGPTRGPTGACVRPPNERLLRLLRRPHQRTASPAPWWGRPPSQRWGEGSSPSRGTRSQIGRGPSPVGGCARAAGAGATRVATGPRTTQETHQTPTATGRVLRPVGGSERVMVSAPRPTAPDAVAGGRSVDVGRDRARPGATTAGAHERRPPRPRWSAELVGPSPTIHRSGHRRSCRAGRAMLPTTPTEVGQTWERPGWQSRSGGPTAPPSARWRSAPSGPASGPSWCGPTWWRRRPQRVAEVTRICNEPLVYDVLFRRDLGGAPYPPEKSRSFLEWAHRGWREGTHFVFLVQSGPRRGVRRGDRYAVVSRLPCLRVRCGQGQLDPEARAPAGAALGAERAVHGLRQALGEGQPQPRALDPALLGAQALEGREQAGQLVGGDAGPAVGHHQAQAVLRGSPRRRAPRRRPRGCT